MTNPTIDQLLGWQSHDNFGAFVAVLAEGESSNDESAWTVIVGGQHFTSFDDHPRVFVPQPNGTKSSAAGKLQITATTWDDFCSHYGKMPFTPENQLTCGAWLIWRAGAMDDVIAGRLDAAIRKLSKVWTSLSIPKRQQEAPSIFAAYGGRTGNADSSPVPVSPPTVKTKAEVKPMFAALIPLITQLLPQLIPALSQGHDSDEAKQWQGTGTAIANVLQKATNTDNIVQAVAAMQTNPDALAAAHAAVNEILPQLMDAGGSGLDGARKASMDPNQLPFWKQPALIFFFFASPLVYMLAYSVFFKGAGIEWSDDARMMVATGVIALIGGGMAFFWNVVPKRSDGK